MSILNNHIYSMTRSTGVERSQQPVVCQHQHWSVVDGISSLLPNKSLFQMSDMVKNVSESNDDINKECTASDILSVPNCQVDNMSNSEEEHDLTLTEHKLPLADILNKEIKHSGTQSRFRIVKIESKGLFKRGRWTCRDFADPPEAKASDLAETQSTGSSSSTEPVFYVQGTGPTGSQLFFYSEGHPVLESDALPCASKLLIDEIAGSISTTEADSGLGLVSVCQPTADNSNDRVSADSGLKSIDVANSDAGSEGTVGTGVSDRHHDFDRMLWPVGQEEVNTPSLLSLVVDEHSESPMASGSMSEIDSKIEQAMDLVKAHLMLAVRAEIEELKEQIKQLMVKNHQLEYENNILRAAADPDLIASLDSVAADSEFDNGS